MLAKLVSAWRTIKVLAPVVAVVGTFGKFLPFGGALGKILEGVAGFFGPLLALAGRLLAWLIERLAVAVRISLKNFSAFAVAYVAVFALGLYMAGVWRMHDVIPQRLYDSVLSENDDLFQENTKLREKLGKPPRTKGIAAKKHQARTAPSPGDLQRRALGGN
jgi:hypothetical protein